MVTERRSRNQIVLIVVLVLVVEIIYFQYLFTCWFIREEHEIMKKTVTTSKTISSEEFDKLADAGSDKIDQYLDWENATRPGLKSIRFNIDVPAHFLEKLDREAQIRGLTRQALVKSWLYRAWQTEGTKV